MTIRCRISLKAIRKWAAALESTTPEVVKCCNDELLSHIPELVKQKYVSMNLWTWLFCWKGSQACINSLQQPVKHYWIGQVKTKPKSGKIWSVDKGTGAILIYAGIYLSEYPLKRNFQIWYTDGLYKRNTLMAVLICFSKTNVKQSIWLCIKECLIVSNILWKSVQLKWI